MTHYGKAALDRLVLRRKEKVGDTGVALGSILDYVASLETDNERLRKAIKPFAMICMEGLVDDDVYTRVTTVSDYFHAAAKAFAASEVQAEQVERRAHIERNV